MILKMPDEDVKEFYRWYISHPYTKGIREVIRIVGSGRNKEIEGCWANCGKSQCKKEND